MFQQSFLETKPSSAKPFSVGLSLLLQAAAIAFLALLPLIYGPGLPSLQLRALVLAVPPPPAAAAQATASPAGRIFTSHRFVFHPVPLDKVAQQNAQPVQMAAAPGIDVGGSTGDPTGSANAIFGLPDAAVADPPLFAKPAVTKPSEQKALRVGGTVAEANLLQKVQPIYPPLARSARVSGTVEFSATISREGRIENLQLLHGHPLLVNAARQAILQWRYRPTMLNGQAVEVLTNIIVRFDLN